MLLLYCMSKAPLSLIISLDSEFLTGSGCRIEFLGGGSATKQIPLIYALKMVLGYFPDLHRIRPGSKQIFYLNLKSIFFLEDFVCLS